MKKQFFVVNHGTYPFDILVGINVTDKETIDYLEKKLKQVLDDECRAKLPMNGVGRTLMMPNGATVLRVNQSKSFYEDLAHEVFHAVEFLFDRIGLVHSIDGGEAWAYQIQHITKQILQKIK